MLQSRLFWQLAGTYVALVLGTAALPRIIGSFLSTLVLLAGLVLAFYGAARIARRTDQLAQTVEAVVIGQSVPPMSGAPADEFTRLTRSLDELIRRYQEKQTQIVREQQAVSQAQEAAERANTARSDFLAILSHEIRTPLNGVMGMTQLALQTRLDSEQREYLEIVQSSADFLLAIINDLRDFARREADGRRSPLVRFPLRQTLAETVKLLGLRAQQKGLELLIRFAPDVPDVLDGDPDRLRQLLVNLLANAITFTERGEVVLSVARAPDKGSKTEIALSASLARMVLHFQVRDTGIGMSEDKLASLLDSLPTDRPAASGALGLNIARQVADGMGGSLWAESVPGQGTIFHFSAPFQLTADTATNPQAGPLFSRVRVLLVDDNATSRQILTELLTSWQMRPTSTATAAEALAALEDSGADPFGIAVVDAHMPQMDGFALVDQIRQHPERASLPILMLIAAHPPEDAARCRQMQIAARVMKPLHPVELLLGVRKALNLQEKAGPEPPSIPAGKRALRVLVAEANPANRQLAVVVLEKLGHQVKQATNGQEALALLEEGGIELLLLDPQLPDPAGLEIAAGIRAREKETGAHLAIIALIPYGMTEDRERCRAAGVDSYLAKPLQMQDLVRAIESVRLADS